MKHAPRNRKRNSLKVHENYFSDEFFPVLLCHSCIIPFFFFKYLLNLFLQVVLVSDGTPQVMQPTAFEKGMSFVARSVISADLVGKGSTLHAVPKMGKDLPSH